MCRPGRAVLGSFSNLGILFVLSFYHFERSCSAFVASFSSPLDALAVSPPFGTVSVADTLLTTQAYIFWRSLLLLEPSTLFSFARARITRLFPTCPLEDWVCTAFHTHLQFCGRVSGVYFGPFCIFLNSIRAVRCALLIVGNRLL